MAPLLVPPFRALFLNENGDFVPGTATNIWRHGSRRAAAGFRKAAEPVRVAALRARAAIRESLRNAVFRIRDVTSAYGVLAAAQVLRACGYPQRALFHRLHGSESLTVPLVQAGGDGVARFEQRGHGWKGDAVESLARSSDARWLLWRQDGRFEVCGEMLAPFADESTFAVSVQTHYRGWKRALVPMAPFRALAPGAASQVLAPLSCATLVDRRKLLALGIPRCGLAGTAWLIFFWKAAAAGWRSYSIGQREPIGEQPDFPAVETEFFFRFLCRPDLRRLAPREPDMARGAIAFAPTLGRGPAVNRARPRVLVVSPFLPYPISHGGAARIYNLCRVLSDRVDFALAAIREKDERVHYEKLHEIFERVAVVDIDELPSRDRSVPEQVRHHQSASLRALVARFTAEWKPDMLQIEYTHIAAFRGSAPHLPAILVEHDLTFNLYHQLAEKDGGAEAWREYKRWHNFEQFWLRTFDSVWTVSEEDREAALAVGSSPGGTFAVPNGVDTRRFVPWDDPADAPEIFYVGSFRHLPNVLGFEKLLQEVMPRVWRRHPNARARVVAGPRHTDYWNGWAGLDARIVVHGFVEDLRPHYATASVVVVPLEISAGTNIKVLEAMACGKAIVTTPTGCAGLGLVHGEDALIENGWDAFGEAVSAVLSDDALRRRLAGHARRTAERRFSWTAIADRAFESYEMLRRKANLVEVRGQEPGRQLRTPGISALESGGKVQHHVYGIRGWMQDRGGRNPAADTEVRPTDRG